LRLINSKKKIQETNNKKVQEEILLWRQISVFELKLILKLRSKATNQGGVSYNIPCSIWTKNWTM